MSQAKISFIWQHKGEKREYLSYAGKISTTFAGGSVYPQNFEQYSKLTTLIYYLI